MNFNLDYNDASGDNITGCSTVVERLPLPVVGPQPAGGRDAVDPSDPMSQASGRGTACDDYGPTCYTDIDPFGNAVGGGAGPRTATSSPAPTGP